MSSPRHWPAVGFGPWPEQIDFEHGIWGKVHGAASDFRWIARSSGFAAGAPELARRFTLGREDAPCRTCCWLPLEGRYYAAAFYPSKALDASGRPGGLEKQILEWQPRGRTPAALGALLLLPRAAAFDDGIWRGRHGNRPWDLQPDFFLPIDDPETRQALAWSEEQLREAVAKGLEALCERVGRRRVGRRALETFYGQLLSGQRPARLYDVGEPLPAEALAALLLPLPRELADRVSLAGWIPSRTYDVASLGKRWDALVIPSTSTAPMATAPVASGVGERAALLVEALFAADPLILPDAPQPRLPPETEPAPALVAGDVAAKAPADEAESLAALLDETPPVDGHAEVVDEPEPAPALVVGDVAAGAPVDEAESKPEEATVESLAALLDETPPVDGHAEVVALDRIVLPGLRLRLTEPAAGAPPLLREIHAFAGAADRRWLSLEQVRGLCPDGLTPLPAEAEAARHALCAWVIEARDQRPFYADARQWQVKVDLLRALALILAPHPTTLAEVGLPTSPRIPALWFAQVMNPKTDADQLIGLGPEGLCQVLEHSLHCLPRFRDQIMDWLKCWRCDSLNHDVIAAIDAAVAATGTTWQNT